MGVAQEGMEVQEEAAFCYSFNIKAILNCRKVISFEKILYEEESHKFYQYFVGNF